jgi:hypothetical protein
VRDQGKRPTCVAFSLSDLHASIRSAQYAALSVEYLYYQACRASLQFDPHRGVTLQAALDALRTEGQPDEAQWPYLAKLPSNLASYQPPTITGPIYRKAGQSMPGRVLDKIAEELDANRPSTLVFRSSLRFVTASVTQPITWSTSDTLLMPHAVVAVAIGQANSERFVRIKNSWGVRWADSGYAWLSEEYVNNTFRALVGMV